MPEDFKFRALTEEDWVDTAELSGKDGLRLKAEKKYGCYTSKPLDSGIPADKEPPGCRWHRIVLDADIPENSTLKISYYTSETKDTARNCNSGGWSEPSVNARDALVQAAPGRYITLKVEFNREGDKSPVLRQVKIFYQRISYLRYLPAVYQENRESREFLERFLSIFESALYDSDETISRMRTFFDPMAAPEEFYRWLAGWLSLDLYDLLRDRNREFILHAVEFYKKKGTVSGIASLVSFLTGKKCCVKEYMNNVFRSYGMEHDELDETFDELGCTRYYHRTSKTIDTEDSNLLAKRGNYDDEVHYVLDTREKERYFPNVIEIFIFPFKTGEEVIIEENQLHKIINSFLPVFVRVRIKTVEKPFVESYSVGRIGDSYTVKLEGLKEERFRNIEGSYIDSVDWIWFYSYYTPDVPSPPPSPYGSTYEINVPVNQRTFHRYIRIEFPV